ncbi:MAG: GNAT family N-acetyltransferase [Anaerolineae bacterium]|nr:GNAT family N-acetyltransferase [Anaerolineae bacterium]
MKEALEAVIEYGFTKLGLNRIQAFMLADNARSINLLKHLHFRIEDILQEHRWFRNKYWDNMIMALLQREWEARSEMAPNPQNTREY